MSSRSNQSTSDRRPGVTMSDADRARTQAVFLDAFAAGGVLLTAARKAKISRNLAYQWRDSDPDFAARFAEAVEDANDVVRGEIWRRGVAGWIETTKTTTVDATGGEEVKTVRVRKHSDAMLALLARSRMPEYRDSLDVSSKTLVIGAQDMVTAAANDPEAADIANAYLARIATIGLDAGGTGVDRVSR